MRSLLTLLLVKTYICQYRQFQLLFYSVRQNFWWCYPILLVLPKMIEALQASAARTVGSISGVGSVSGDGSVGGVVVPAGV